MKLLKSLIIRLSDSLLASMPQRLKVSSRLRAMPMLRLVSHNPHPVMQPDPTIRKPTASVGHSEFIDEGIRRSKAWLLKRQHADGFWVAELEAEGLDGRGGRLAAADLDYLIVADIALLR